MKKIEAFRPRVRDGGMGHRLLLVSRMVNWYWNCLRKGCARLAYDLVEILTGIPAGAAVVEEIQALFPWVLHHIRGENTVFKLARISSRALSGQKVAAHIRAYFLLRRPVRKATRIPTVAATVEKINALIVPIDSGSLELWVVGGNMHKSTASTAHTAPSGKILTLLRGQHAKVPFILWVMIELAILSVTFLHNVILAYLNIKWHRALL